MNEVSDASFAPGENVRLKSSMERITAESIAGGKVHCVWLYAGAIRRVAFDPIVLAPALEDPRAEIRSWLSGVGPI